MSRRVLDRHAPVIKLHPSSQKSVLRFNAPPRTKIYGYVRKQSACWPNECDWFTKIELVFTDPCTAEIDWACFLELEPKGTFELVFFEEDRPGCGPNWLQCACLCLLLHIDTCNLDSIETTSDVECSKCDHTPAKIPKAMCAILGFEQVLIEKLLPEATLVCIPDPAAAVISLGANYTLTLLSANNVTEDLIVVGQQGSKLQVQRTRTSKRTFLAGTRLIFTWSCINIETATALCEAEDVES